MNQEWCCTSKVAATRLFRTTKCWQAQWKRLSLLQVKFLFDRKPPTSIKPEATLGKRIDLRISGQFEILFTQDEKEKNISFFLLDETSLEFSKQIDDDYRFNK